MLKLKLKRRVGKVVGLGKESGREKEVSGEKLILSHDSALDLLSLDGGGKLEGYR